VSQLARDYADVTAFLRPILRPEHDGEQERPDAHGHVGDVEGRPPGVAHTDVEEVDHAVRRLDAIEQIAQGAAAHERQRDDAGAVAFLIRRYRDKESSAYRWEQGAITPLVIIPFSYHLEGERPTLRSLAGGALAVLGAAALAWATGQSK